MIRGLSSAVNFDTEQVMNEILASMKSHSHWHKQVQNVIHIMQQQSLLTHLESDLVQNITSDHWHVCTISIPVQKPLDSSRNTGWGLSDHQYVNSEILEMKSKVKILYKSHLDNSWVGVLRLQLQAVKLRTPTKTSALGDAALSSLWSLYNNWLSHFDS